MISPLLTDLYQLTMAYGYWKLGLHEREAVFQLSFRHHPFQGKYAVACGLGTVIDFLQHYRFSDDDLAYLASLQTPHHQALFPQDFLTYLGELRFTCDIDAMLEGTVVFAEEPLLRIKGPLLQAQLLESILLNIINFQTLIATKAARVAAVTPGDTLLEFGMRRAQGPDGALSASRAAYIGGCAATSNVLAGKQFDIPVRGTHAHSWVTVFSDEITAFSAYAEVMPDNCVLLVDTYHTLEGVKNAITIGKTLREKGFKLQGVRLDSGDLVTLSQKARQLLDQSGFENTAIIASNRLDEYVIADLKAKGACINTWGVGTNLVTAYDYPALDGIYKLSALRDEKGNWDYKLKLSEQVEKISHPGICQVRRFYQAGSPVMDVMYDTELGIHDASAIRLLLTPEELIHSDKTATWVDLLTPIFRQGQLVCQTESIHTLRARSLAEIELFQKKPANNTYPIGLEANLYDLKQQLIAKWQNS